MKTKITIFPGIILIMVVIISTSFTSKKKFSMDGVWSIVEVQTVKPDGKKSSKFPKESLAIFAGKHYSFC
jgi:hypothetical protein